MQVWEGLPASVVTTQLPKNANENNEHTSICAKRSAMIKSVVSAVAKYGGNMLAVLARIGSVHDTCFDVTFAPVEDISIVGGPFLHTGASIETSVIVSPASYIFNFTLQPCKARRTGTVHPVVMKLFFEWKLYGLRIDPGVRSKFSMPMPTDPAIVTKEITRPIVPIYNAGSFQQNNDDDNYRYIRV